MSTYPVDIKTVNITTATDTTIFDGPARILGLSWVVPTNVGVGTITVLDDIEPYIPDNGVLFDAGAYITVPATSVTGVTVFYDG